MTTILAIITLALVIIGLLIAFKSSFDNDFKGTILGICIFLLSPAPAIIYYHINKPKPILKTEYELELINQDSIKIYNGSVLDTIHINNLEEYIDYDNI